MVTRATALRHALALILMLLALGLVSCTQTQSLKDVLFGSCADTGRDSATDLNPQEITDASPTADAFVDALSSSDWKRAARLVSDRYPQGRDTADDGFLASQHKQLSEFDSRPVGGAVWKVDHFEVHVVGIQGNSLTDADEQVCVRKDSAGWRVSGYLYRLRAATIYPPKIGVELSGDGDTIQIHFGGCSGEWAKSVDIGPRGPTPSDESDLVAYWEVTSQKPNFLTSFDVGATPSGYIETVPFHKRLTDTEPLYARVGLGSGGAVGIPFELGQLEVGSILTAGIGYLSPAEFAKQAENQQCPTAPSS